MPLAACRLPLLWLPCRCQQLLFQLLQRSFKVQTLPVQFPQLLQASADFGACHQADLLLERLDSNLC
jgi:hypothetical protein